MSGTISASLPRHVVAERIHRLRQEASRGALQATPARFGACWSLVGSWMVFGPPEHAIGLTSNWHRSRPRGPGGGWHYRRVLSHSGSAPLRIRVREATATEIAGLILRRRN